jgi:hypothetical protein
VSKYPQLAARLCLGSPYPDVLQRGTRFPIAFAPWFVIATALVVGCGDDDGPPRLQIHGHLTNAGEPLRVAGADVGLGMVVVEFYPLDEKGQPPTEPLETAHVPASGEFNLVDGIPPGRYRIAVRQWDPYPQVDRLENRFDVHNTKIVRDLTDQTETLEIDVSRPEG